MKSLPRSSGDLLADWYADTFDTALVDKLGYRVPTLLFDAVRTPARSIWRSIWAVGPD